MEQEVAKYFTIYYRQADMFKAMKRDKNSQLQRAFSFEVPPTTTGRRIFFYSELGKFWFWYRNLYGSHRHFYEIVQENLPCRLYFDLEYIKAENPSLDPENQLKEFIEATCAFVRDSLGLEISYKSFLLLDSTTPQKFSVHAICHLPNASLFPNNIIMRDFVRSLIDKMSSTGKGIVKNGTESSSICDPVVYTRNRNFRIYLSSKCSKTAVLKLHPSCKFYETPPAKEELIFLDSLIIPKSFDASNILTIPDDFLAKEKNSCQPTVSSSVIPQVSTPILPSQATSQHHSTSPIYASGTGGSPLKELDQFVCDYSSQLMNAKNGGGSTIEVRQWRLGMLHGNGVLLMQYELKNFKFCLNIQRDHISNNVYWICDFDREEMYQKCFDQECRDFRSPPALFPMCLLQTLKDRLDAMIKPFAPPPSRNATFLPHPPKRPKLQ